MLKGVPIGGGMDGPFIDEFIPAYEAYEVCVIRKVCCSSSVTALISHGVGTFHCKGQRVRLCQ